MLPSKDRRKLNRRQRAGLLLVAAVATAALAGLYQLSQPRAAGLPTLIVALTWQSPTPPAVAQVATGDPPGSTPPPPDPPPAGATASSTLPPWLAGYSTPTRPNEPGPTSTPSAYFVYLPGVSYPPTATPLPVALKTEPPPAPPTPRWPDGLTSRTDSKIGLHVVRNSDTYIMEFVRRVRPRVIKAVDDLGWLADVKAASPNTVTIGRISGQNESWPEQKDPAAAAREYVDANLPKYRANTGVDYWEAWNEFVPVTTARWQWYAAFEAARACDMQDLGLHAAVGGFAAGTPEYSEMALFVPALEGAHKCGGIFTLHEGVSPLPGCGVFSSIAGVIPGAPSFGATNMGYFMLRYRFWYEGYLKPRGLDDLPLVISELEIGGLVPGQACNGPGGASWKFYSDYWIKNGVGPDGPHAYVNLLAWYDSEIRQDPYVVGAAIFTAGAPNAEDGWNITDVHDAIIPLAYYEVTQH